MLWVVQVFLGNNKCQPHGEATGNIRWSLKAHHLGYTKAWMFFVIFIIRPSIHPTHQPTLHPASGVEVFHSISEYKKYKNIWNIINSWGFAKVIMTHTFETMNVCTKVLSRLFIMKIHTKFVFCFVLFLFFFLYFVPDQTGGPTDRPAGQQCDNHRGFK